VGITEEDKTKEDFFSQQTGYTEPNTPASTKRAGNFVRIIHI
jgi:hypothetical protein